MTFGLFTRKSHIKYQFSFGVPQRHGNALKKKTLCLKITQKVSIYIASYVYILSGQKFIKIAKNSQFGEFLKKCDILSNLQTLCLSGKFKMYLG